MAELAAYVCSSLEKNGIDTVLSGGCCVEIYSNSRYTSDDIDLIDRFNGGHRKIKEFMESIGFKEYSIKRYFVHKDTKYFVEFPRGPLGIGDEVVKNIEKLEMDTGILKLLSTTDCIKDRLAGYYYWDDMQNLEQAVMVALENDFDIVDIEKWSKKEGKLEKFNIFKKKLQESLG